MAKDPTTIAMTKGDTATFHFHREDADGKVIITKADKVFFTVKKYNTTKDTAVVFQKTIEDMDFDDNNHEYHFTINPEDTDQMEHRVQYIYDLEVIANGIKTTIAKGRFELEYEVTAAGDEE